KARFEGGGAAADRIACERAQGSGMAVSEGVSAATHPGSRGVRERLPLVLAGLLVGGPLLLFILYPLLFILGRSFATPEGFGLDNYLSMLTTARFLRIVYNSFEVTLVSTFPAVCAAFLFAYGIQRTRMPGRSLMRIIALVPLFAPSLVQAQGLVLLFGRNGLINRSFSTDIDIYGY